MYVPLTQDVFNTLWVLAKTNGDPNALTSTVRQVLGDMDKALPAYSITPLTTVLDESVAQRRFSMLLILLFGGVALFLSAVGLYGVVSYTVSLRTKEIGLRMAIGAQPRDVLTMIIGGGMKLALVGVVLGVVSAFGASQLVESMLFEVRSLQLRRDSSATPRDRRDRVLHPGPASHARGPDGDVAGIVLGAPCWVLSAGAGCTVHGAQCAPSDTHSAIGTGHPARAPSTEHPARSTTWRTCS
jgi:ABC-type antimicrobial peptide transport system permease subunit